jgi:hypothetical protein
MPRIINFETIRFTKWADFGLFEKLRYVFLYPYARFKIQRHFLVFLWYLCSKLTWVFGQPSLSSRPLIGESLDTLNTLVFLLIPIAEDGLYKIDFSDLSPQFHTGDTSIYLDASCVVVKYKLDGRAYESPSDEGADSLQIRVLLFHLLNVKTHSTGHFLTNVSGIVSHQILEKNSPLFLFTQFFFHQQETQINNMFGFEYASVGATGATVINSLSPNYDAVYRENGADLQKPMDCLKRDGPSIQGWLERIHMDNVRQRSNNQMYLEIHRATKIMCDKFNSLCILHGLSGQDRAFFDQMTRLMEAAGILVNSNSDLLYILVMTLFVHHHAHADIVNEVLEFSPLSKHNPLVSFFLSTVISQTETQELFYINKKNLLKQMVRCDTRKVIEDFLCDIHVYRFTQAHY